MNFVYFSFNQATKVLEKDTTIDERNMACYKKKGRITFGPICIVTNSVKSRDSRVPGNPGIQAIFSLPGLTPESRDPVIPILCLQYLILAINYNQSTLLKTTPRYVLPGI